MNYESVECGVRESERMGERACMCATLVSGVCVCMRKRERERSES